MTLRCCQTGTFSQADFFFLDGFSPVRNGWNKDGYQIYDRSAYLHTFVDSFIHMSTHRYTRLQTVWSLPGHSRQANKGHSPRCHRPPTALVDSLIRSSNLPHSLQRGVHPHIYHVTSRCTREQICKLVKHQRKTLSKRSIVLLLRY